MCEVNRELLAFLKMCEGVRHRVYRDSAGLPTVGVGHLVLKTDNLKVGDVINDVQVNEFLARDVQIALAAVNDLVKVAHTPNQCIALTSFVFNLGEKRFKKSSLLRYLNAGRTQQAADEFLKWVSAGGKKQEGLVNRRAAEKALFLS
jgi:lysozyme